jgi:hypothetical protein
MYRRQVNTDLFWVQLVVLLVTLIAGVVSALSTSNRTA